MSAFFCCTTVLLENACAIVAWYHFLLTDLFKYISNETCFVAVPGQAFQIRRIKYEQVTMQERNLKKKSSVLLFRAE